MSVFTWLLHVIGEVVRWLSSGRFFLGNEDDFRRVVCSCTPVFNPHMSNFLRSGVCVWGCGGLNRNCVKVRSAVTYLMGWTRSVAPAFGTNHHFVKQEVPLSTLVTHACDYCPPVPCPQRNLRRHLTPMLRIWNQIYWQTNTKRCLPGIACLLSLLTFVKRNLYSLIK